MSLFETLADLEENVELHLGRLLILMEAFGGETGEQPIEGITKIAELDFLLRYPTYLERAILKRGGTPRLDIKEHERQSVESKMVRYRYGPWDDRYRRMLNFLITRGFATLSMHGRTFMIGLTAEGVRRARALRETDEFRDTAIRADQMHTHLDRGASFLQKFIYETFPEIGNFSYGEAITT